MRDEDFVMLPNCGDGVRKLQHEHMVIGRNEIGFQHLIRTLAGQLDMTSPDQITPRAQHRLATVTR